MSLFEKPTDRRNVGINLKLTEAQVAAVDRIAKAMNLSGGRSDVLRAGLECLIQHNPIAAEAAQLNEGSEPS